MQHTLRVALAQFDGATTMRALPLAAGVLAAAVRRADDLRLDALTILQARRDPDLVAREVAHSNVVGLSMYAWNERYALEVSRRAKRLNPELVVVAGGPSVPRRENDVVAFFERHTWVDALVAGEGERVFVDILRALQQGERFDELPGVSTTQQSGSSRNVRVNARGPRLQRSDFIAAGSPYLDGTFDDLLETATEPIQAAIFETNRGCPFSCTFCDWGAATESRVHEIPIERVEAELRWAAAHRIPYVYIIDANFGIRPRDIEITRYLGKLRAEFDHPHFVYFHLTKNAAERNLETTRTLRAAGIGTHVALSMQDFDPIVLRAIDRDNIRPERALALRARSHELGIPTTNELLLGLPAQTLDSFCSGLTRALTPFPGDSFTIYPARILVNAPMAERSYREEWGLITRSVPSLPRTATDEHFVIEREEVIVGSRTMLTRDWRTAFAWGNLLAALANQHLATATLRVMQFGLDGTRAWIDAMLAATTPRLSIIRDELLRYADAILEERGMSFSVSGFGDARRDVVEVVVARVVEDVDGFAREAGNIAAALFPSQAELLQEALTWDRLNLPEQRAEPAISVFSYDWPAYLAAADLSSTPALPLSRSDVPLTIQRHVPNWVNASSEAYLDQLLAHGWTKRPRVSLIEIASEDPAPGIRASSLPAV